MPYSLSSIFHLSLLLLFLTVSSLSAVKSPPVPVPSPSLSRFVACKSTLYPKLCRSILSTIRSSPSDPYEYGKFSVKECKKQAKKTSNLINRFLATQKNKKKSYMSQAELRSLEDCRQLSELSVDYLETISYELNSAESLSVALVDRVQTLLSAIVTNQQTCFDGLEDSGSSIPSVLSAPFSNTTELYSVSLGLVSHALGRSLKRKRKGKLGGERFLAANDNSEWRTKFNFGPESKWPRRMRRTSVGSAAAISRNLAEETEGGRIQVNDTVTVSKDGINGNFTTIGDAIAFAPNNTRIEDGYFVIYVMEGVYEDEYIVVPKYKKYIMLLGDGINRTVITGNRSVIDGWTTFNSATFAVSGEGFVAIDITFKNTAGPEKHQAVAVRNNADLSTFYRCSFEGYQDTLYIHSLRQFYRECDVYGTVDFIFGNSASVFQNCNLIARKPLPRQKNAVTAQGRTDPNQNTGISIHNCTITASPDLAEDLNSTRTFLGRPWKEYSRTVFMQSFIDSVIDPVGWLEWNGTVGLSTLYYGEFQNYGPGANTSMRVQWPGYSLMNAEQAVNFTVYNFTMGDTWLPSTDIPFSKGLL
ncbi:Pectinesterase [Macleaya cordata]|uniref:Pectinesterase n=1 Tax=Macleaya cordata TaxID=56857 RepID=A0A200PZS6_MACCD|nr:Pectinesterase [Macleaya cordata]